MFYALHHLNRRVIVFVLMKKLGKCCLFDAVHLLAVQFIYFWFHRVYMIYNVCERINEVIVKKRDTKLNFCFNIRILFTWWIGSLENLLNSVDQVEEEKLKQVYFWVKFSLREPKTLCLFHFHTSWNEVNFKKLAMLVDL